MSNAVFPTSLSGLNWNCSKTPTFNTKIQAAVSGRESRAAMMAYPLWSFKISFEFLLPDELQTLGGFFLARRGQADSFLYTDDKDKAVVDQSIGTGNGTNRYFQLVRSFGGFIEPVENVNGVVTIKVNGVTKTSGTDYTISTSGLVTFTTAPGAGLSVTWSGSYYFRCRFLQDASEFNQFMNDLFELKSLAFKGATGNKV